MIVRFWSARVAPAREEEYLQEVRERVIPEFEKLAGCLGAFFTRRDREGEVEYRVLTMWASWQAVEKMAGADPKQAYVPPEIATILSRFDTTAEHFESVIEHDPRGNRT